MTELEALYELRTLFGSEDDLVRNWHNIAEDPDGNATTPVNPKACRFCVYGGYDHVVAGTTADYGSLTEAVERLDFRIADPHTLAEVHALIDLAIKIAGERF